MTEIESAEEDQLVKKRGQENQDLKQEVDQNQKKSLQN